MENEIETKEERDALGRFAEGNTAAKGHGRPRNLAARAELIRETLSDDDIAAIITTLKNAALDGDLQAAKLILSYAAGTPRQQPENVSDDEMRIVVQYVNHDIPGHPKTREFSAGEYR